MGKKGHAIVYIAILMLLIISFIGFYFFSSYSDANTHTQKIQFLTQSIDAFSRQAHQMETCELMIALRDRLSAGQYGGECGYQRLVDLHKQMLQQLLIDIKVKKPSSIAQNISSFAYDAAARLTLSLADLQKLDEVDFDAYEGAKKLERMREFAQKSVALSLQEYSEQKQCRISNDFLVHLNQKIRLWHRLEL